MSEADALVERLRRENRRWKALALAACAVAAFLAIASIFATSRERQLAELMRDLAAQREAEAHRALVVSVMTGTGRATEKGEVPLVFSGGHEIGRDDYGRPVPLIAAALGVTPEQFREAFSGVTPAKGRGPTGVEARKNKAALMEVLGPLGVTNERLDEVSDYFRFRPQDGELWTTTPAEGYAVVDGGQVEQVVVTAQGSGYSTPPTVTVQGMEGVALKATLHLDRDLRKNGSIASVELTDPKPAR